MSDYAPDEYTAKQMYVLQRQSMHNHISPDYGAEFDRFVGKVKADALREAADALPKPVGLNCNPECHSVDWASLRVRADLIEGASNE